MDIQFNKYQSSLEELNFDNQPEEIKEWFMSAIDTIPLVRWMVSPDRPTAAEAPHDDDGKVIVDITKPHILTDMDYFRKSALHFKETGRYTDLRPNPNPNSEFGQWFREEIRRCYEGLVRPEDGEWIPGDLYYFWNYAPMQITQSVDGAKEADRVYSFPDAWEGHYLKAHMIEQARRAGEHYLELASRSRGKSYYAASMLARRYELGEKDTNRTGVTCYATAYEKKYLVAGDQTLDKFQYNIDFIAQNMPYLPHRRLVDSLNNMQWTMGYKDVDSGTRKGTGNSVIGITAKDDEAKLRGTRGVLYIIEEGGNFPRLKSLWSNLRPSVEFGNYTFGMLVCFGTAGDSKSDFEAMQEMMYHPDGFNIYSVDNVYDKAGTGNKKFGYFFPAYMNNGGSYNSNGVSDVTKALMDLFTNRYKIKYGVSDQNVYFKAISENPITPQEAVLRTKPSVFPVADIKARLNQLDSHPEILDSVMVCKPAIMSDGEITMSVTADLPIRSYYSQNNSMEGAVEIYELPVKNEKGRIPDGRYIAGLDPIDADSANTDSLFSMFVMDKLTKLIVCEWTGRLQTAEECYERARRIALYYNATIMIENNKIGIVAYFKKMNCVYLLADTPQWMMSKDIIKTVGYGNRSIGIHATEPVNRAEDTLTKDFLLSPYNEITANENNVDAVTTFMVYTLKCKALLEELMTYNPEGNFDRVRAFGILMCYFNEFVANGTQEEIEKIDVEEERKNDFLLNTLIGKKP